MTFSRTTSGQHDTGEMTREERDEYLAYGRKVLTDLQLQRIRDSLRHYQDGSVDPKLLASTLRALLG